MTDTPPTWLTGILAKRHPDSVYILLDLVQAGLKWGECSANDVTARTWDEPNIIGATCKLLPQFGFSHDGEWVLTQAKQKHGRPVRKWVLTDRGKAERFVGELKQIVYGRVREMARKLAVENRQGEFWRGTA